MYERYHFFGPPCRGVGFLLPFVCLSVFGTISQITMLLGPPNVTHKCSTMSPENPFIFESRGQRSRSRVTKQCCRWPLHACECWLFLVSSVISFKFCHSAFQFCYNYSARYDFRNFFQMAFDRLCTEATSGKSRGRNNNDHVTYLAGVDFHGRRKRSDV